MRGVIHKSIGACCFWLLLAWPARAQEGGWMRHFRIGGSVGLNISGDFKTSGQLPVSGSSPGPLAPRADHFYDDGFVRVDNTGNAQGLTSFWGYDRADQ